jgi:putative peptide zinc metalloprotease protein
VYVDVPGRLESIPENVKEGQRIGLDQPLLATLVNPDLELAVVKLRGQLRQTEARELALKRERFGDDRAFLQLKQIEEIKTAVKQQLEEQERELERLNIVAPVAGVIIPAPPRPSRPQAGRLPTWTGSPLDRKNLGAAFAESDLICHIGDPNDLEALLVVDQADIELVEQAMLDDDDPPDVDLQLDAYPGKTLTSRIVELARVDLKVSPASLSSQAGGTLNTKTDPTGVQRPMSTSYQARVPLDDQGDLHGLLCTGLRGRAKVHTRKQSLGKRMYRYLARTFHFDM